MNNPDNFNKLTMWVISVPILVVAAVIWLLLLVAVMIAAPVMAVWNWIRP